MENLLNVPLLPELGIMLLAFGLSIFWTHYHFRRKPKLTIEMDEKNKMENELRVKVENKQKKRAATNIKVEACVLLNRETYHFHIDRPEVVLLPPKKVNDVNEEYFRIFKSFALDKNTENTYKIKYEKVLEILKTNKDSVLRVRVHAIDEKTQYGKYFEEKFFWNGSDYLKV